MSLRVRLTLGFTAAVIVLIAIVGVAFVLQLRASLDAALDVGLASRAATVAEEYRTGGLSALGTFRDDEPVQVLDVDGRILLSSPDLGTQPLLDPPTLAAVAAGRAGADGVYGFTVEHHDEGTRFRASVLADGLVLVVGTQTQVADTADAHVDAGLLVGGPLAAVLAGLGAWWLSGAALRPVERMRRQSADLAEHDDGTHLAVPRTRDEIAALARTLNALLDRQRHALALERQALDRERGFVADAGHELRTPLATLRAELELAGRPGRDREALAEAVASASTETDRLIRLAEDLLTLARADSDGLVRVRRADLGAVAADSARAAAALGDTRDVDVVVEAPRSLAAEVDPDRLRQALDNLLVNALRHSPDHGLVTVTVTASDGSATLAVADDGPGFPADFLPHAFERFRRADEARARSDGGSGLGLSIVDTIARAHGGSARAENRPDGGAVVTIELPVAVTHESPPPTSSRASFHGPRAGDACP